MRVFDHPSIDWVLAPVLAVVAWQPTGLLDRLAAVDAATQRAVFGSSATVLSILAGFTVSAMFFFASSDSERLEDFRDEHGPLLNRTLVGAFVSLVGAVVLMIAAALAAPSFQAGVFAVVAASIALTKLSRMSIIVLGMLDARYVDVRRRVRPLEEPPSFRAAS